MVCGHARLRRSAAALLAGVVFAGGCGGGGRRTVAVMAVRTTPAVSPPQLGVVGPSVAPRSERRRFGDYDADDSKPFQTDSDGDDTDRPTDGDGDNDNPLGTYYDRDDASSINFGTPASPADRSAIIALVRRFYAAAATRDGGAGCALLAPKFAQIAAEHQYRQGESMRVGVRAACAQGMSALFARDASEYAAGAKLPVALVLVKARRALLLLASRDLPAIWLQSERGEWKLGSFFDRTLQ